MAKEKREKKESTFNKIMKVANTVTNIIDKVTNVIKNELNSLKKRLIQLGIAFGLIFISVLIMLIGLGEFLTNRFSLYPGIGSIILGACLLILTLLYLAIKR